MDITLNDATTMTGVSVLGGKEQCQNAWREYLEFVLPQEGNTVENLEATFSVENCERVTLIDPQTKEQFIHKGYVLRGPVRVFAEEDGVWKIAVRRYRRTDIEQEVAELQKAVAKLVAARVEAVV